MQAHYHPGPLPEAAITAVPAEFAAMAARIAELATAGNGEVAFPAADRGLAVVIVRISVGPIVVAAAGGVLSVSGSSEAINLFGRNMPDEPSLPVGYHVHFEHPGREWHVAAESVPLVLMVGKAADAGPSAAPDLPSDLRHF